MSEDEFRHHVERLSRERDQARGQRDEAVRIACELYGDLGKADYHGLYTDWAMKDIAWLVDPS
jgi:hypothetical protein